MQKVKSQFKIKNLRKKHPKFVYEKYFWKISGQNLEIFFDFKIEPNIKFKPKIVIKKINKKRLKTIEKKVLENFIFHLGLTEIPSYWKATCSPIIEIRAGYLNKEQINWWKNLIIQGMGQFFYENKINFQKKDFLNFNVLPFNKTIIEGNVLRFEKKLNPNNFLVPVGGGKDSIVALELLKRKKKKINAFLVNPTKFAKAVVKKSGIKNPIIIERTIDPKLLQLNKKGFLNGHTPFTALLSFLAVFCALLFDYKNVVFSNEKSANEGNVKYLGKIINHQWSKSSEFEKMFRFYLKKYLAKNINYFSLLRNYTELEISKMFLKYPKYFSVFSSCNKGIKIGERWCGNCPKCLFVYATFYPFLDEKTLFKIFGKEIFENKKLLPIMKALLGQKKEKPFECVGTKKESKLAFYLSVKKAKRGGKIPYLLTKIK